jgi:hypothetical protein
MKESTYLKRYKVMSDGSKAIDSDDEVKERREDGWTKIWILTID